MSTEYNCNAFLDKLAGDSAAPGGGSAAALAGSMAAALASMVAGLTLGKKKFAEVEKEMSALKNEAGALKDQLADLVDRDAQAYLEVMAAFRLPKESDEEKSERSLAIQAATLLAAQVPLETMRAAGEVCKLLSIAARFGNPNACTDVGVGALLASAAAEGAYRNVAINLDGMKDRAAAARIETEAKQVLTECLKTADAIRNRLFPQ